MTGEQVERRMTYTEPSMPPDPEQPWAVLLVCCGRDDGTESCATWGEADRFRQSYIDAPGHDRAGIIVRTVTP